MLATTYCLRALLGFVFSSGLTLSKRVHATHADTVFINGTIYTLDRTSTKVQALAISNGTITFVGSDIAAKEYIAANTTVVNLHGRMAMPGLIDSHVHILSAGQYLTQCNLDYMPLTIEQVIEHVQKCVDAEPAKNNESFWLEAVNLDVRTLLRLSGSVTSKDIDKIKTKRPVSVRASTHHTLLVNTLGMRLSNITSATKDPANGRVERLPGTQEPSGVFQDGADSLVKGPDPPTAEEWITGTRAALKLFREAGVTTFQDASARLSHGETFEALRKRGELTARAYSDYQIDAPASPAEIDKVVQKAIDLTSRFHDRSKHGRSPTQKYQAVKVFMDGGLKYPSNTGALLEPYFERVGNSSEFRRPANGTIVEAYWKPAILNPTIEKLFLAGLDAQLHAIGDRAVRYVLDAVEAFRQKHPNHTDYKVAIAHASLIDPSDYPRFSKLGVDAIMSYQWAQPAPVWSPWTFGALGPARTPNLESYGTLTNLGRPVVYGSDWPIDPLNEFLALQVAVTRKGDPDNARSPAAQYPDFRNETFPGVKLTREAALRSITIEGARFLRANDQIGSLEVGKLADVIVLEHNYFEVPEADIAKQKVLLTMVGGDVLYVADGVEDFKNLKPRYPNHLLADVEMKSINGFEGRKLPEEVRWSRVGKIRRRSGCGHKH